MCLKFLLQLSTSTGQAAMSLNSDLDKKSVSWLLWSYLMIGKNVVCSGAL
jgi:hypothetical protein